MNNKNLLWNDFVNFSFAEANSKLVYTEAAT